MSCRRVTDSTAVYQAEALSWLKENKNPAALAGNRFHNTANAIEAVQQLYAAGAVRVEVIVTHNEPERIAKDGGSYADELEVTFPKGKAKSVIPVIKILKPNNAEDIDFEKAITETEQGDEPFLVWGLWWD